MIFLLFYILVSFPYAQNRPWKLASGQMVCHMQGRS